ncbi:hypothetical protein SLEP1_g2173 [Rubroshorea leprosula]|uniref:Uncharacterized protein n=1 Tax=Rubroshorea leprosula TaxID=152421 RepID=A0AAV5HQF0_9ROSI|nr:hypothetical protein SLEP1_g2173 [Rubroshorea leprosula]
MSSQEGMQQGIPAECETPCSFGSFMSSHNVTLDMQAPNEEIPRDFEQNYTEN